MNSLFEWLSTALETHSAWALFAALGWGLTSVALSPCHLASVPIAVSFLSTEGRHSALRTSLELALGVLVSLAAVGVVTVAAGRIAGDLWGVGPWIAVGSLLFAGLYLLGVVQLPSSLQIHQERIPRTTLGAILVGLLLGVTLGPCTFAFFAPVFAVAFGLAEQQIGLSSALVASFALGHTLAIATAGVLGLKLSKWISHGGTTMARVRGLAGAALLLSAIYIIATIP